MSLSTLVYRHGFIHVYASVSYGPSSGHYLIVVLSNLDVYRVGPPLRGRRIQRLLKIKNYWVSTYCYVLYIYVVR